MKDPASLDAHIRLFARALEGPLNELLRERGGLGDMHLLCAPTEEEDDTLKLGIRDASGRPCAVLIGASPANADLVGRYVRNAAAAWRILGPSLGSVIPQAIRDGEVDGRSYVIVPFFRELSSWRPRWWVQRTLLRGSILDWLRGVAKTTVRDPTAEELESDFLDPLRRMTEDGDLDEPMRSGAARALAHAARGSWKPRYVLAHNDFYKGNILLKGKKGRGHRGSGSPYTFVVIDWAGARTKGHPLYDLVRFSISFRIRGPVFRKEVRRHCAALGCGASEAEFHLLGALAYLGCHLEFFPKPRYVACAGSCYQKLHFPDAR